MKAQRLDSLDAFRGLTIAGMILVNNPGSWRNLYTPLGHAPWHGWTPTDLVFPFFLFIVGVAMALAFARRREAGVSSSTLLGQVVRRSVILFLLGLCLVRFPDPKVIGPFLVGVAALAFWPSSKAGVSNAGRSWRWPVTIVLLLAAIVLFAMQLDEIAAAKIRVPGVLQRIAVCYLLGSVIMLVTGTTGRLLATIALLVGYSWIMYSVAPPAGFEAKVVGPEGLLHEWIDQRVLGDHLYSERPDPEGLLSTLGALATTLLGVLTGQWLHTQRQRKDQALGMFAWGNVLLLAGCFVAYWIPLNKKIWTASYVLLTGGLALQVFTMCFWMIDIKGWRRWSWPLLVFGTNAILVYCLSSAGARVLGLIKLIGPEGNTITAKAWLLAHTYDGVLSPKMASLAWALTYVAFWLLVLIPLYRRRIFIRV